MAPKKKASGNADSEPKTEIPEDTKAKLQSAGHTAENYYLASMNLRSATDTSLRVLRTRMVRAVHKTSGKYKFMCLRCNWSSECAGLSRPLEHVVHYAHPVHAAVEDYLQQQGLDFDESKKKEVQNYRAKGSRTAACSNPDHVTTQDLRSLSKEGAHAATMWCKLLESSEAQAMRVEGEPQHPTTDPKELQRLHALAVVHSHQSFNSVEGKMMKLFFQKLCPHYKPPTRTNVREILDASAEEVAGVLEKQLRTEGPWCLVTDGATIANLGFLNIGAMSASGR